MGKRAVIVMALMLAYLAGGVTLYTGIHNSGTVGPPANKTPSTAVVFANESGVFVKIPLELNEEMWVDGIAVVTHHGGWLVESYETRIVKNIQPEGFIEFLVRHYFDTAVPVRKMLKPGIYVFNVTGYVETVRAPYPVWGGKAVIDGETVPLEKLGTVEETGPVTIDSSATITIHVYDKLVADANPTILSGWPDYEALEKKAYTLFAEGNLDGIEELAETVLEEIVNGIRNGTIIVGYYGNPLEPETANRYLDSGRLVVEVLVSAGVTVSNATLTTSNGFKYYLATWKRVEVRVSTEAKPEVKYEEREMLIPVLPEPDVSDGAVIVFYRETPYSKINVLVLPLKPETIQQAVHP